MSIFGHEDRNEDALLRAILYELQHIHRLLSEVVVDIGPRLPKSLAIIQLGGNDDMPITGVPVGGSGTFVESLVPTNAALPAGQVLTVTWSVSDPTVTMVVSPDGTSVVVSVPAGNTNSSFNLTATGTSPALSAPITSGPVAIPIIPTPPPLPTALTINQTA